MSERVPLQGGGRWLYDGFGALDGGIDSNKSTTVKSEIVPNGLDRNQVAYAVNCTMRGGNVTHRQCYAQRVLTFPDTDTRDAFEEGIWQGATFYESTNSSLVASINGHLYQIRVQQGFQVVDISIPDKLSPSTIPYAWFVQLGPFLVKQDGSSIPLIFNGTSTRQAAKNEIKTGTVMAVAVGRIWYATADGFSFRATDLAGNTFTGKPEWRFLDSGLLETENTYLNEGGDFVVPPASGGIRAMITPAQIDTSLGQGPLQVFTEKGAFSVNAPFDRTTWKNLTYPIQTVSQFEYGALGDKSTTVVNGDIFYRALDGIRSFQNARKDFHTWLNTPISKELEKILDGDNSAYLSFGSAITFRNRLLHTVWPRPTNQGFVHDGLVPLDFDLISSMRQRAPVAWEGVLTGLSILQLVKGTFGGIERAFAFVLSTAGKIELWEIIDDGVADQPGTGPAVPISWSFESPSFDFQNSELLKRLMAAAIWIEDVQGEVTFTLQYRPDRYPCWIDWYSWTECAPVEQCLTGPPRSCKTLHNYKPQYRPKVKIGQPQDTCNPTIKGIFRDGYEFAFRLQVSGHAVVKKMRFATRDLPETTFEDCSPVGACVPLECCGPDPLSYQIPGEGPPTES